MSGRKLVMFLLFSFSALFATDISPVKAFVVRGNINDTVFGDGKIYAATMNGKVDIVDVKSGKIEKEIVLPNIKDFMGDTIDSEIFSVDVLDGRILILSQDNGGFTRLDLFENGRVTHILDRREKLYIVKAKFVTKSRVLLGLLSNVYMLYDIKKRKTVWEKQISMSKFSNFALNDEKTEVATADESGDVSIVSLKEGKVRHHFDGINKDEVFGIDWKKNIIITGGKDKKVALYDTKSYSSSKKAYGFFIYSVALSSDAKTAAASINDKNDVVLFDTASKEERVKLVKNGSKIVSVIFINEDREVLVAANNDKINLYQLKGK